MNRRIPSLAVVALFSLGFMPRPAELLLEPVPGWPPRLPSGWKMSGASWVAADHRGRVYLAQRDGHPLLRFDENGKFLAEVGAQELQPSVYYDLRKTPPVPMQRRWWVHGLHIDPWDNVWVTDVGRHTVMKFSPEGKLLLTLGTPDKSGESDRLFNQPTNVWVAPSGQVYVTDGYGNSRVAKFASDGTFIKSWGKPGTGPGEFHTPHAVTLDAKGNVYVTDRENNRIQVFDPDGRFLTLWPDLHSVDAIFIRNGVMYAGAGLDNKILKLDLSGKLLGSWGPPGGIQYPHGLCADTKGNLYVAEGGHATKFRIRSQ